MSGPYTDGTPINLVERFWDVNPVSGNATPADPTTVTFTITPPAPAVPFTVVSGDPRVTNPFVGMWICALAPQPPGDYVWNCEGVGAVVAKSGDHTFEVTDSADALVPDLLQLGPCQPWITGEDVAACMDQDTGVGSNTFELDTWAAMGSALAFECSMRRFPGVCTRTVRPCQSANCAAWDLASGLYYWGWGFSFSWPGAGGNWGWRDWEGRRSCGCNPLSTVKLAGYPVRQIRSVKIDGIVLPRIDPVSSAPNWRLDKRRDLIRMDTPAGVWNGGVVTQNFWPSCQNLALDDDQPGTFSVTYDWGQEPPVLGKQAAAALARELFFACNPGTGNCVLPSRATKVIRQGVEIDRILSLSQLLITGASGIQVFDAFMAAYNRYGQRRVTAVYSPDVQPFATRVGP